MLMDLFFQHSPIQHKRRAHFHEFMAEVHERIYAYRQNIARGEIADGDVIALTASATSRRPRCCASTSSRSPTSPTP